MENGNGSLTRNGTWSGAKNGSNLHCPTTKNRAVTSRQHTTSYDSSEIAPFVPTRLQLLTDLANLCTLLGAVLATIAMACMWKKK